MAWTSHCTLLRGLAKTPIIHIRGGRAGVARKQGELAGGSNELYDENFRLF